MQIYSLVKIPEMMKEDFYQDGGVIGKEINIRCIEEHFWVANGVLVKYTGKQVNVRIPEEVKTIGDWIFVDCSNMESVFIPLSISHVGRFAFANCKALSKVIYEGTEDAWQQVAGGRKLSIEETVQILCQDIPYMSCVDNNLFKIKDGALEKYSQKGENYVIIPFGVTSIGNSAFWGCSDLESIKIPSSVTYIGTRAFGFCENLKQIEITQGVIGIGTMTFYNCWRLRSIVIPSSVTYIGDSAFWRCSHLERIVIPNGVIEIGPNAFGECSSLKSIEIPKSVTKIGGDAFSYCSDLKDIYYKGSQNKWKELVENVDISIPKETRIHYNYRK